MGSQAGAEAEGHTVASRAWNTSRVPSDTRDFSCVNLVTHLGSDPCFRGETRVPTLSGNPWSNSKRQISRMSSSARVIASVVLVGCAVGGETHSRAQTAAAARYDTSLPLGSLSRGAGRESGSAECPASGRCMANPAEEAFGDPTEGLGQTPALDPAGARVEQRQQGTRPAARILESFNGLGVGFAGPNSPVLRNPSDNSLAVGPDHTVQTVNSRLAIYTKKGTKYDTTGAVLYGAVATNMVFSGFGGACEQRLSGDAVVRYDQLAKRWLFVLPIFSRPPGEPNGPFSMCYAVSEDENPLGRYHRYEFKRALFPDYPRPAIWPDGYYVPTSTGDDVIQKHACVAERARMLNGEPAREQCIVVEGVNFLNNADIDGYELPPAGAPNVMMAAGGTQLKGDLDDDGIYVWRFHVDWRDTSRTALTGPHKVSVAPYQYLCGGQLTTCVPQPETDRRLDAQGDKLMTRLVYRSINGRESVVGVHSVNTAAGAGGVRWYEFRIGGDRTVSLIQQGTFAPDSLFRWMGSPGMDRMGNISLGYSFGGATRYTGQRVASRLASDPPGRLTFRESVVAEGKAPQRSTLRWEDYTTLAMDPDDCRFWYVGDYLLEDAVSYSTRIAAWRLPGCTSGSR